MKRLPNIGPILAIKIGPILQLILVQYKEREKRQYWLHIGQHIGPILLPILAQF
jgi:hypothetical protein